MFANDYFHTIIKLPLDNVTAFEKKMEALQKVAAKLHLDSIKKEKLYTITEYRRAFINHEQAIREVNYIVYEVSGRGPVLEGWNLLAALDFEQGKNAPMVRTVPGQEIPSSYFNTNSFCEHCHSQRFRKVVYVLKNEEKTIQVGSSCLKDFIGHGPIEEMVKYFTYIQSLKAFNLYEEEKTHRFGINDLNLEKDFVLTALIKFINKFGYVSRKMMDNGFMSKFGTTSNQLSFAISARYFGTGSPEKNEDDQALIDTLWNEPTPDIILDQARAMLEEIKKLDSTKSSFNHNLKVLANASYWKIKDLGFVAAMYPVCSNLFKKEEENNSKKSNTTVVSKFIGYEKEKVQITVNIKNKMRLDSEWGISYLHACKDENGNIIIFYNKKELGEKDSTIKIKGTIKSLNTYKGEEQTVLNYVKLV